MPTPQDEQRCKECTSAAPLFRSSATHDSADSSMPGTRFVDFSPVLFTDGHDHVVGSLSAQARRERRSRSPKASPRTCHPKKQYWTQPEADSSPPPGQQRLRARRTRHFAVCAAEAPGQLTDHRFGSISRRADVLDERVIESEESNQ